MPKTMIKAPDVSSSLLAFVESVRGDKDRAKSFMIRMGNATPPPPYTVSKELIWSVYSSLTEEPLTRQSDEFVAVFALVEKAMSDYAYVVPKFLSREELAPLIKTDNPETPAGREKSKRAFSLFYWRARAFLFDYLNAGSCSYRAAYSALALAQIFRDTPYKVGLCSFTAKDHYVVQIYQEGRQLIYDPTTNPSQIFELTFYKEKILPLYPENALGKKFEPTSLRISPNLSDAFNQNREEYAQEVKAIFEELSERDFDDVLLHAPLLKGHVSLLYVALERLQSLGRDRLAFKL